ncbi:hypothetical protein FFJ24_012105 [Pedobacter sp. KBS0701]|uniref:hypothetical protein n=1 Tax=Pedobacter sp. KBS0701 TaxID=2578106 RepID=UPI00110E3221|nr:hypothetical protein [Pedobacter sp. KBS0701]QDW25519.1 hypothetical protein FFJ24_012105 [Pedobacter sp. KBS0701]
MENSKLNLGKTGFEEILSRDEMKEIMLGSGSGSGSGSGLGSGSGSPPQSACTASCTCPDGTTTFEVRVICKNDCRAVSEQGVECVENGVSKGAVTCRSGYATQCYTSV